MNQKTVDTKSLLLALMAVLTTCTLIVAQTTVIRNSIEKVKVTATKDSKTSTNNIAITVIGIDTADADSADANTNSSSVSTTRGKASFTFGSDGSDFSLHNVSAGGGILVTIIAIIAVFGFPVLILSVIFFFHYKNWKTRYCPAEQVLAADQPLPAEFIRENKAVDSRSQDVRDTFMGIGFFISLWAITGEFGIGAIGLLVTFMGIGQWIIGSKQQIQDANVIRMYIGNKDEKKSPNNVRTDSLEIIPSESEKRDKGVSEEKNDGSK